MVRSQPELDANSTFTYLTAPRWNRLRPTPISGSLRAYARPQGERTRIRIEVPELIPSEPQSSSAT